MTTILIFLFALLLLITGIVIVYGLWLLGSTAYEYYSGKMFRDKAEDDIYNH